MAQFGGDSRLHDAPHRSALLKTSILCGRDAHTVDRGGVRQDGLHVSEIDTDRDRAGTLSRSIFAEPDEMLPVQLANPEFPEPAIEEREARRFRPADPLADLFHVLPMKPDEISELVRVA